jgi:hypothetical protein
MLHRIRSSTRTVVASPYKEVDAADETYYDKMKIIYKRWFRLIILFTDSLLEI